MMNVKLVIAAHKQCPLPQDDVYLPVHVGAALSAEKLEYTRDDTGDNISTLNPLFSELTGLYWAWKNLNADYIGLVHYRRFFASGAKEKDPLKCCLTAAELEPLLAQYKLILPYKRHYYIETIYSHYSHTFDGSQLDKARDILAEKFPAYLLDFDAYMRKRSGYVFNMMVLPRELLNDYCSWLFAILFELAERVDATQMTAFEKRYAGRVSERLFNVWLSHKLRLGEIRKSDIKELPCIFIGKVNWSKKIAGFLKARFLHKKYDASF